MTLRPISFVTPLVRSILDGKKTQTRRVARHRYGVDFLGAGGDTGPDWNDPAEWGFGFDGPGHHGWAVLARGFHEHHNNGRMSIPCPFGDVGDRLWVRESASVLDVYDSPHGRRIGLQYVADDARRVVDFPARLKPLTPGRWMPNGVHREGARIILEVTEVRVERLQSISDDDAVAEGYGSAFGPGMRSRAFDSFWDELGGAGSWSLNPWVWVVGFKVVEVRR